MLSPLYGQLSPLRIPTRSRFISNDSDVAAYILAVEAADGQQLEEGVITAVESFIVGCKTDALWSAIKASCILAGARTLSGALVSLVGTSPTNANFVSGDYSRKTGLLGNGSTKYLNTNIAGNSYPQDNVHLSIYVQSVPTITVSRNFCGISISPQTFLSSGTTGNLGSRCRTGSTFQGTSQATTIGFKGISRNSSASYILRSGATNSTRTESSAGNPSQNFFIFASSSAGSSDARIAFYSIGESLTLGTLDARVSTLMTDLAAAIP